eukprot:TRINITY_DN3619_c0_g1_i2.p1 TRINITY_DN3619_c0_g1~~TRINITY_DN3619_c0_g1_i2.p1  ORF type:complete len:399 (-),score=73.95 TRINITY_DN3619_c0_g1_i2:481-1677(-)
MDENIGLLCQETKLDDVLLNKELEDSITRFSLASPSAHVRESISSVDACQDPIDAHESANSDHPRKQSLTNTLTRIGDELLNGHNIETCSRRLSFKRALQFSQTPEKSKMNKDQSSTGLIPRNLLVDLTDPCDVENLPPQLKQSDSKVSNSAPTTCEANPQDHVFSIHTRNRLQFQRSRSMFELGSLQGCHDIQGGAIEKEGSAPRSNHARFPKSENSEHPDLYYISAQTAVEILEGKHESTHQRCIFIDCRYPFEYSGGSIRGAINTPTPEQAVNFLFEDGKRRFDETALVFFCEFSSQRGPCAYPIMVSCLCKNFLSCCTKTFIMHSHDIQTIRINRNFESECVSSSSKHAILSSGALSLVNHRFFFIIVLNLILVVIFKSTPATRIISIVRTADS